MVTSRRAILRDQLLPLLGTTAALSLPAVAEAQPSVDASTSVPASSGVLWKTRSGVAGPATPSFLSEIMKNEVLGSISCDSTGIICISERHDDFEHHKVQLKVLMTIKKSFAERSQDVAKMLSIGMEMFQRDHQTYLDKYIAAAGEGKSDYTIDDLKTDTNWDSTWGYDILHYAPVLMFARKWGIRLIGLHASDALVEIVKHQGLSKLPPEIIEGVCTNNREHSEDFRRLAMQTLSLSDFGGCKEAMELEISRQYEVQCFREEYMAETAALQMSTGQADGWIAILAGENHIVRRNGLPFRAMRRLAKSRSAEHYISNRGVFTIVPKTTSFPIAAKEAPGRDSADYVWFVERDPSSPFIENQVNLAPPRTLYT